MRVRGRGRGRAAVATVVSGEQPDELPARVSDAEGGMNWDILGVMKLEFTLIIGKLAVTYRRKHCLANDNYYLTLDLVFCDSCVDNSAILLGN